MSREPIPADSPRSFWYGLINYEQKSPTREDFKLDRMRKLMALLGDPQKTLRIIHVAGSKGKGSTSAMLASILQAANFKTGLFTSPHLNRVEERIRIQGQDISSIQLDELLQRVRKAIGENPLQNIGFVPTFFEVATAVAFLFFAQEQVDFAVLEVGLGGRLDSTNVCNPLVCLITSISFDHEAQLGNTLAKIAFEKAGIIKPAVPVLTTVEHPEALNVIREAAEKAGARLVCSPDQISWRYNPGEVKHGTLLPSKVKAFTHGHDWPEFELSLLGPHQAANASLVLACIHELQQQGIAIPQEAIKYGLANTQWLARMEVFGKSPLVVLDCAHNRASAKVLVNTLGSSFPKGPKTLLFGVSVDKDIKGMFAEFGQFFEKVLFTQSLYSPRAAKPEDLAHLWSQVSQTPSYSEPILEKAMAMALEMTPPDGILCVTGSVFLAGEVRSILPNYLPV